jgi:hypothetical protein
VAQHVGVRLDPKLGGDGGSLDHIEAHPC